MIYRPSVAGALHTVLSKCLTGQDTHVTTTQSNATELLPGLVTYSPSNHGHKYKQIGDFLSLVLSKLIKS